MNKAIEFTKKHPVLTSAATLALAGAGYCAVNREAYCTVAEGEVIEDKYVPEAKDEKAPDQEHYVLFLRVREEIAGNKEEIYVLRVKESEEMPVAVLDEIIRSGSRIAFPYLNPHFLTGTPDLLYPSARFGTVASNNLKVIHPWESSEAVRDTLEGKIEERKKREHERFMTEVHNEAKAYHY